MDVRSVPEGPSPSPICAAFLLKLGRTPDKAARRRIVAACVKVRRPWVEELLWEALADPNETVRTFVGKELRRLPELRLELAVRRLSFPPWFARSAVLEIIGERRKHSYAADAAHVALPDANAAFYITCDYQP